MERVLERRTHRVGDHLTDAAPADQARHRKQHRRDRVPEFFAAPTLSQCVQVVGRAAAPAAVERVGLAVFLGQRGLDKRGGSAQQGSDPHPEHRACTAGRNRRHHAHQVAHAHPGGGGHHQGLEGGKPLVLVLFAHGGDHIPEQPHRQQAGAQGEPDIGGEQQHDHRRDADAAAHWQREQIAPQQAVNKFNKMGQQEQGLLVG